MSSMNASLPAPSALASSSTHLDNTLGAALVGLIVSTSLFGVTNVQALTYFTKSTRDPRYLKRTVAILWFLDTLHIALVSHFIYFYLVTNFTNLSIITKPTWSLCLHVFVTTLTDFIVRMYYTRRVWILSTRNKCLTLGLIIFTFVHLVSGLGFAVKIFSYHSILQFSEISWVLYTSLGSGVAADLWVAISLCYFLGKSRTGYKSTDTVITALTMYIISSGLLTSLCSTCCLITYAAMPNNYIFIGFYFSLPKLYFNSLLATLNARDKLRDSLSGYESSDDVGPDTHRLPSFSNVNTSTGASRNDTSFGTINILPEPLARKDFSNGEKDNRAVVVDGKVEISQLSDEGLDNDKLQSFPSPLPL